MDINIDFEYETYLEIKNKIENIDRNDILNSRCKLLFNLSNNNYRLENKYVISLIDTLFQHNPELKQYITDINNSYFFFDDPFSTACLTGNKELVEYLYLSTPDINMFIFRLGFLNACISGNISLTKYLLESRPSILKHFINEPFIYACHSGNFEMIKYIYKTTRIKNLDENEIFVILCTAGSLEPIEYFIEKKNILDLIIKYQFILETVARNGHLEMLDYLISHLNEEWFFKLVNISLFDFACKSGNKDILEFLIQKSNRLYLILRQNIVNMFKDLFFPINENILEFLYNINPGIRIHGNKRNYIAIISLKGNFEYFKGYLKICDKNDFSISFNNNICLKNACSSGNIDLFKYILVLLGYTNSKIIDIIDNNLVKRAYISGNLELIKFLLEKKPDIDLFYNNDEYFHIAYKAKKTQIVEYMLQLQPYLIYKYRNKYFFINKNFEKKIRLIQKCWKNQLYNPYKKRGKQFILKQIDWAFE